MLDHRAAQRGRDVRRRSAHPGRPGPARHRHQGRRHLEEPQHHRRVDRAALDTGYACPRVATAGADIEYNEADARHTVRRYLARFVGTPLDAADKEGTYPLVCKASPATWDPAGTGKAISAPLADNPGKLTGATKFADQEISSERLRGDYLAVEVPVTNSAGVTKTRTFTLTSGPQGYCIGDVSP
ncbi:hypothetical protein ACFYO1_41420 [Nocardia sp. NPDC006044]|uniref:hypothetical protein n=1 Tax=Nocardia sp. NPDC006044 TaxID=3364306 RepID=UPI00369DE6B1